MCNFFSQSLNQFKFITFRLQPRQSSRRSSSIETGIYQQSTTMNHNSSEQRPFYSKHRSSSHGTTYNKRDLSQASAAQELQSLIRDNHKLAQEKKNQYHAKLSAYDQKIVKLEKILVHRGSGNELNQEEEILIFEKIEKLCLKRSQTQQRLDKLIQIEQQIETCLEQEKSKERFDELSIQKLSEEEANISLFVPFVSNEDPQGDLKESSSRQRALSLNGAPCNPVKQTQKSHENPRHYIICNHNLSKSNKTSHSKSQQKILRRAPIQEGKHNKRNLFYQKQERTNAFNGQSNSTQLNSTAQPHRERVKSTRFSIVSQQKLSPSVKNISKVQSIHGVTKANNERKWVFQQLYQQMIQQCKRILQNGQIWGNLENLPFSYCTNSSLEEMLMIIAENLQLKQKKLLLLEKQSQECKRRNQTLKSLEYDRHILSQECEQYEQTVHKLIQKERALLEEIDSLENRERKLRSHLEKAADRVNQTLKSELSQYCNLESIECLSDIRPYSCSVQAKMNSNLHEMTDSFEENLRNITRSISQYEEHQRNKFVKIQEQKLKLQTCLENLKSQTQSRELKLHQSAKDLKLKTEELENLAEQISQSEDTLQKTEMRLREFEVKIQNRKMSLQDYDSIIQTKKESIRELEEIYNNGSRKKKELYQKIQKMEICLEEGEVETSNYHLQIKVLCQEKEEIALHLDEVSRNLSKAKAEKEKLALVIQEDTDKLKQITEKASQLKNQVERVQQEIQCKNKKLSDVQKCLQENSETNQCITESIETLQRRFKDRQEQLSELNGQIDKSETTKKKLKDQIQTLCGKNSLQQSKNQELCQKVQKSQSTLHQLSQKMAVYQNSLDENQRRNQEAERTKDDLEKLIIEMLDQKQQLLDEVSQKHTEIIFMEESYEKASQLLDQLETELESTRTKITQQAERLSTIQGEISDKSLSLQEYQEQEGQVIARINTLKKLEYRECLKVGLHMEGTNKSIPTWREIPENVKERINQIVEELSEFKLQKNNKENNCLNLIEDSKPTNTEKYFKSTVPLNWSAKGNQKLL